MKIVSAPPVAPNPSTDDTSDDPLATTASGDLFAMLLAALAPKPTQLVVDDHDGGATGGADFNETTSILSGLEPAASFGGATPTSGPVADLTLAVDATATDLTPTDLTPTDLTATAPVPVFDHPAVNGTVTDLAATEPVPTGDVTPLARGAQTDASIRPAATAVDTSVVVPTGPQPSPARASARDRYPADGATHHGARATAYDPMSTVNATPANATPRSHTGDQAAGLVSDSDDELTINAPNDAPAIDHLSGTDASVFELAVDSAPVESARPAEQIARVLRASKPHPGVQRVEIELTPEHLGSVTVELTLDHGALHVTMVAESAAASDALRQGLDQLRAEFGAVDVRTLDVRDQTQHFDSHPHDPGRAPFTTRDDRTPNPSIASTPVGVIASTTADGQPLDVRI